MEKEVKKLYRGCIELRDYDVNSCIKRNEAIKVRFEGHVMTLSPEDLSNKLVSTSKTTFQSKMGGKSYKLLAYDWTPDEVEL